MSIILIVNFFTGLIFALQLLLAITTSILVLLNRTEDGAFQKAINLGVIKTDYSLVSKTTGMVGGALIINTFLLNYLLIFKYKIMYI